MALPQQVINQMSQPPAETPGWSAGILAFCSTLFIIAILIYCGMIFAYGPYLNSQITANTTKITQLSQSISSSDETRLIAFYSQISNLQSLLKNHVTFSEFLAWLEQNTESNIYFSTFSFASGNQITLTGFAKSEADINQEIAILQTSPDVKSVAVSTVSLNTTPTSPASAWQFSATLVMQPSLFISPLPTIAATSSTVPAASSTTP